MVEPLKRRSVNTPAEADALARELMKAMQDLHKIIDDETNLLRESRLRDATALTDAKTEASRAYVQALENLKANAVALARWAPNAVAGIKSTHELLADALQLNMTVLATVKSVSEGIMRSVQQELSAPRTLTGYGAAGRAQGAARPASQPILMSKTL